MNIKKAIGKVIEHKDLSEKEMKMVLEAQENHKRKEIKIYFLYCLF